MIPDYLRERHDAEAHSTHEPDLPDADERREWEQEHRAAVERAIREGRA